MTYIREFTVHNLAGRGGKTHRELDRHVNIFWGLNGTGKTTLLKILDAALSNDAKGLETLPFDSAEVVFHSDIWSSDFRRTFTKSEASVAENIDDEIFFELESTGEIDINQIKWSRSREEIGQWQTEVLHGHEVPEKIRVGSFNHSYLPISRVVDPRRGSRLRDPYASAANSARPSPEQSFVQQVKRVWADYSARSNAQIRSVQQQGLASVLATMFGGASGEEASSPVVATADEAYEVVTTFLRGQNLHLKLGRPNFLRRYAESGEHRMVVSQIQDVYGRVEQILVPQLELQAVIDEMYLGNKHLVLSQPQRSDALQVMLADKQIPLGSLSSGEKQLLQVLLEVLAVGDSTAMIDEPELSLHVDWQQRLVASMRRINSEAQLLLATHSPEVMVDVPDECVFEL